MRPIKNVDLKTANAKGRVRYARKNEFVSSEGFAVRMGSLSLSFDGVSFKFHTSFVSRKAIFTTTMLMGFPMLLS